MTDQHVPKATLRFQPTRRPQLQQQKPKPRANFPKAVVADATITAAAKPAETAKPVAKPTLADWANVEDETFYEGEKRQRGGRKKRKKNREEQVVAQDWDDIYDPTRPNNYEEYKHSDEKIREVREWKDRLYAHRMARQSSEKDSDEEEEAYRPRMGSSFCCIQFMRNCLLEQINLHHLQITHLHRLRLTLHHLHLRQKQKRIQSTNLQRAQQRRSHHRRLPQQQVPYLALQSATTYQPPQRRSLHRKQNSKKLWRKKKRRPIRKKHLQQQTSHVPFVLGRKASRSVSCPSTAGQKVLASVLTGVVSRRRCVCR
jgi:hypothetical protein